MTIPIIYKEGYIENPDVVYSSLVAEVPWVSEQARRKEAFMAMEPTTYRYIDREDAPVYESFDYHPIVKEIQERINSEFNVRMDLCFLNYYEDEHQALGWHSDDADIIDHSQPICVVSLGEARELWVRPIGFKGEIPQDNRYPLGNGSLFVMPPGFQQVFQHRIPKGSRKMGGRISLTYRSKRG